MKKPGLGQGGDMIARKLDCRLAVAAWMVSVAVAGMDSFAHWTGNRVAWVRTPRSLPAQQWPGHGEAGRRLKAGWRVVGLLGA